MEEMKKYINDFISDNWGTEEGEAVYRKRCYIFDDDEKGITELYNYVKSIND